MHSCQLHIKSYLRFDTTAAFSNRSWGFDIAAAFWNRSCVLKSHLRLEIASASWNRSCVLKSHLRLKIAAAFGNRVIAAAFSKRDISSQEVRYEFCLNLLNPGRFCWHFSHHFQANLRDWRLSYLSCSCPQMNGTDKSTLVQVMAWCRQATSQYLSHCWPRSMSPCGATRPQRVQADAIERNLRQAASHYLCQCWSISMSLYGVTNPYVLTYVMCHYSCQDYWAYYQDHLSLTVMFLRKHKICINISSHLLALRWNRYVVEVLSFAYGRNLKDNVAFTVWINVLILFIMFMINNLSVCLSLSNNGFAWKFSHWDALCTGKQLKIKNKLEFLSNTWFQNPEELRQKLERKGHEAAERPDVVHHWEVSQSQTQDRESSGRHDDIMTC